MSDLELRLRDLGGAIDWPATPELRPPLPARRRPPRGVALPLRRPLLAAVAGLLVLAGGAVAVSPGLRDAIGDLFGIGGVEIQRVPEQPRPQAGSPAIGFGRPVTLEQARDRASFGVLVPGVPYDEVRFSPSPPGGQVAFVTREPRLLFSQFEGDEIRPFVQKSLGPRTSARNVSVNGGAGVWLEGEPHAVIFRDRDGAIREERVRLAGNVLLWEQSGLTLRLEGARSLRDALAYAAAVRPP